MTWREKQLQKQKNRCYYCEKIMDTRKYDTRDRYTRLPDNACTIDHLFPRSRGGSGYDHNKVLCCSSCNQEKNDKHPIVTLLESSLVA